MLGVDSGTSKHFLRLLQEQQRKLGGKESLERLIGFLRTENEGKNDSFHQLRLRNVLRKVGFYVEMAKEMSKKLKVLKRKILIGKSHCPQCVLLKKANVEICEEAELLRLKNDNLLDQIKGIKENSHKIEEEMNMLASQKQALEKRLTLLQEEEEELLNSSGPIQRQSEEGLKTPQAEYEGYKTLN